MITTLSFSDKFTNIQYKEMFITASINHFLTTSEISTSVELLADLTEYYSLVFDRDFEMPIYDYLQYCEYDRSYIKYMKSSELENE